MTPRRDQLPSSFGARAKSRIKLLSKEMARLGAGVHITKKKSVDSLMVYMSVRMLPKNTMSSQRIRTPFTARRINLMRVPRIALNMAS